MSYAIFIYKYTCAHSIRREQRQKKPQKNTSSLPVNKVDGYGINIAIRRCNEQCLQTIVLYVTLFLTIVLYIYIFIYIY